MTATTPMKCPKCGRVLKNGEDLFTGGDDGLHQNVLTHVKCPRFKILADSSERRTHPDFPSSIAWALVEPLRESCMRAHDQTLERLNERGGLSIAELYGHVMAPNDWYRTVTTVTKPGSGVDVVAWFHKWNVDSGELHDMEPTFCARGDALSKNDEIFAKWWDDRPMMLKRGGGK